MQGYAAIRTMLSMDFFPPANSYGFRSADPDGGISQEMVKVASVSSENKQWEFCVLEIDCLQA